LQLTFQAQLTPSKAHVCLSCRHALSQRSYASAATAQATVESLPFNTTTSDGPATSLISQTRVNVKAGVVLSRPPLLTPDPHPFETAFHLYQRRLNERLVLPFTQYFYFRRGTPAFDHWRTRRRDRGGAATRDIGKYNAYDKESWNDEVLLGDESGQPKKILEQLIEEEGRAEEFVGEKGDVKLAGLRRATEADQSNDQKSLERSLSRTLYLLVKSKPKSKDQPENSLWQFPSGSPDGKESLKEVST
jgi:large subunit ribosomal protein L46